MAITLIFVVIFSVLVFLLIKKRQSLYRYDVRESYNYDFFGADRIIDVSIHNDKLIVPYSDLHKYDTAICEVELQGNIINYLFQPYIKTTYKNSNIRHYFEYGASGKRYIHLKTNDDLLHIRPYRCRFKSLNTKLYFFDNQTTCNESLCVIAPHPDDAEIAAFGLYSDFRNTHIITISASESGKKIYDDLGLSNYDQVVLKGRTRTFNSLSVSMLGGVPPQHCLNYGYFGSTLKKMFQNPDKSVTSKIKALTDMGIFRKMNVTDVLLSGEYNPTWNSLVNDLKYSLEKIQPEIIVLPYPRIDTHDDHKYTTLAVLEALKAMNYQKGKLFLYTNHHVLSEAYPFGSIGNAIPLPPHFDQPLYFESIYSHNLNLFQQIDKAVALESMNVLRPYLPWHKSAKILNRLFKNKINEFYGKRLDYFSRSVRSNELFFVVKIQNISYNNIYKAFGLPI